MIFGVLILAAVVGMATYGISYLRRHFVPVELNRAEAVGKETVDMENRKGIVISFTRVGNSDFEPKVDAVSGASLMEENGRLVGNAGLLGDMVVSVTGFDRTEITVEKKYPSSYGGTVFTGDMPDLSKYDTVVLVFPLWWWTLPVPVSEYVKQADLAGKDIYCLVTHGGSGFGSSIEDLKKITDYLLAK